jgi:hypothetical protein
VPRALRSASRAAPLCLSLLACSTPGAAVVSEPPAAQPTIDGTPADRALQFLTGRFDSADLARSAPGVSALEVTACTAEVSGLPPRALYVEETVLGATEAPRRQRVFVLEPGEPTGATVLWRTFDVVSLGAAAGACRGGGHPRFARDEVRERPGCAVSLHWDGNVFRGGTSGRSCPSTLAGATWASHETMLDAMGFRLWEKAFDANGQPVGKADVGTYVFVRRSPVVAR